MDRADAKRYISELEVNGLKGRILRLPPKRGHRQELLFIYGQHSSLERWWGLAEYLNTFGAVTMPDLPGFGGMYSLYGQGKPATTDNLADYLADFVRQEYKAKGKKVVIAAMSLGFVVTTRMLQRHPELIKKVDMLVSIVGFGDASDFVFKPARKRFYIVVSAFCSWRLPSLFCKYVALRPFWIRLLYSHMRLAKEKFKDKVGNDFDATMDVEIRLWTDNDIRSQMKTNVEMLTLKQRHGRVHLPVYHVASHKDRYFDHKRVKAHLLEIYDSVEVFYTTDPNHAPTIIADAKTAAPFIPSGLARKLLSKTRG